MCQADWGKVNVPSTGGFKVWQTVLCGLAKTLREPWRGRGEVRSAPLWEGPHPRVGLVTGGVRVGPFSACGAWRVFWS